MGKEELFHGAISRSVQANERANKRVRLENLFKSQRDWTLAEYHEALDICQELELDQAWRLIKHDLERKQQQAIQQKKRES